MKKYILHPGPVRSMNDGDVHYVGAGQLVRLYGIRLSECIVDSWDHPLSMRVYPEHGYIHLWPRYDGDYELPEGIRETA